jgi:hypothetical protein
MTELTSKELAEIGPTGSIRHELVTQTTGRWE